MLAGICDGDCFDVLVDGAIILAKARYDCDEDSDVKDCYPSWDFSRIDEGDGFNFRTARYTNLNNTERVLRKLYGVRVVVVIFGSAGKFDIVVLK